MQQDDTHCDQLGNTRPVRLAGSGSPSHDRGAVASSAPDPSGPGTGRHGGTLRPAASLKWRREDSHRRAPCLLALVYPSYFTRPAPAPATMSPGVARPTRLARCPRPQRRALRNRQGRSDRCRDFVAGRWSATREAPRCGTSPSVNRTMILRWTVHERVCHINGTPPIAGHHDFRVGRCSRRAKPHSRCVPNRSELCGDGTPQLRRGRRP
jgi:hypothetical protein